MLVSAILEFFEVGDWLIEHTLLQQRARIPN
jgi:hypothetical protein